MAKITKEQFERGKADYRESKRQLGTAEFKPGGEFYQTSQHKFLLNFVQGYERIYTKMGVKKRQKKKIGEVVLGKKTYKKIFGRKSYKLASTHSTRKLAGKASKKLKSDGYSIRIVKVGNKFSVYKSKK